MTATTTPTSASTSYLGSNPGLDRLLDNVQAEVPAVSLAIIQMCAWNTIEDFYMKSGWRRELVYWTMAPGVTEIDFNPFDENYLVSWVLDVSGLHRFHVTPPGLLKDLQPATALRTGEALLSLKPVSYAAITTAGVGPELWSTWLEVIKSGVLTRLYGMPAKPYSSPQLAMFHGKSYSVGVARARGIADNNFNGAQGGRWAFPSFANGRRKN